MIKYIIVGMISIFLLYVCIIGFYCICIEVKLLIKMFRDWESAI